MPAYIVCYDLVAVGQNYTCIIEKLESYPRFLRIQRSVWVIETADDDRTIAEDLKLCMDANDHLFVALLSKGGQWTIKDATHSALLQQILEGSR